MGYAFRVCVTAVLLLCSLSPIIVLFYLFPHNVRHYYYRSDKQEASYYRRRIIPLASVNRYGVSRQSQARGRARRSDHTRSANRNGSILNEKHPPNVVRFYRLPSYDVYMNEAIQNIGKNSVGIKKVEEKTGAIPDMQCRPKEHVMFLKTHKTGGSTVANMLNRFGVRRNLTFALPRSGLHRFDWPSPFSVLSVDTFRMTKTHPDILCNHARFNLRAMGSLMPKDAIYITILRHPLTQFESSFSFFKLAQVLGVPGDTNMEKMQNFLKYPKQFLFTYLSRGRNILLDSSVNLVRNGMLFDLGLQPRYYDNNEYVKTYVNRLKKSFHLVLLQEYFDESLILLKRMLCWEIGDVLYFKLNERYVERLNDIPKDIEKKILQWNNADMELYRIFNQTFWKKIANQGKGFFDEVKLLRSLNQQKEAECLSKMTSALRDHLTRGNSVFKLKDSLSVKQRRECGEMIRNESDYISYHRTKQMPQPLYVKTVS